MRHTARIIVISTVIAMAAIAAVPGVSDAKKITDGTQLMSLEFGLFQGEVTAKDADGDSFTLDGITKVYLVDASWNGKAMTTSFFSAKGDAVTYGSIKVGDLVFVNAGGLKGDNVAAKDVFVVSGKVTGKQAGKFAQSKKLKSWSKEFRGK